MQYHLQKCNNYETFTRNVELLRRSSDMFMVIDYMIIILKIKSLVKTRVFFHWDEVVRTESVCCFVKGKIVVSRLHNYVMDIINLLNISLSNNKPSQI